MPNDPPLARRDVIAARLEGGQSVVAATLAAEFFVSEDAIRRDLRALAIEGRCRRVYGGALPLSPATIPMAARIETGHAEKTRLARAAVATVERGELLFLDSGSTNLAIVDALPEDADLVIATNAIDIAAAVLRRQDLQLIVVGGSADALVGGCVDAAATAVVSQMRISRTFLGACSVSAKDGIGAFHFPDACFKRAVRAASRRTVVLATAEKLKESAPHIVASLSDIDTLVVEPGTDAAQCAALEAGGCRHVLVADNNG
jgi:DeoR/GlpR family transcriptional regulator of sugar metabolism